MNFRKEKVDDLLRPGYAKVVFTAEGEEVTERFVVTADVEGIRFSGTSPSFTTPEQMEVLAKVVGDASREYVKFLNNMRSKLI